MMAVRNRASAFQQKLLGQRGKIEVQLFYIPVLWLRVLEISARFGVEATWVAETCDEAHHQSLNVQSVSKSSK
jgi:hypothetical protein